MIVAIIVAVVLIFIILYGHKQSMDKINHRIEVLEDKLLKLTGDKEADEVEYP